MANGGDLPARRGLGDARLQRSVRQGDRSDAHRARRYPTRASWAPPGTGLEVADPEAAVAVADLATRGAVAIKVSLNAEAGATPSDAVLAAICDAATEHDLP